MACCRWCRPPLTKTQSMIRNSKFLGLVRMSGQGVTWWMTSAAHYLGGRRTVTAQTQVVMRSRAHAHFLPAQKLTMKVEIIICRGADKAVSPVMVFQSTAALSESALRSAWNGCLIIVSRFQILNKQRTPCPGLIATSRHPLPVLIGWEKSLACG